MTEGDLSLLRLKKARADGVSALLKDLLDEMDQSPDRARMRQGDRYYRGDQDILNKDFREEILSETEFNRDTGEEAESYRRFKNPNRSNERLAHTFHRVLVDQKVFYLVGREPTVSGKGDAAYEAVLAEMTGSRFNRVLTEVLTHAGNEGFAAIHPYYAADGRLCYTAVPGTELLPVYANADEEELTELFRVYPVKVYKNGRTEFRRRVEWWTKEDVSFYLEEEPGRFKAEGEKLPHWQEKYGKEVTPGSFHRVPFILIKNNPLGQNDLERIKPLIDAYDLLASDGVNNLLDFVELYWVIAGYGGETASAIAKKLKINRAVSISDASGKIEAKQLELPIEARLQFLKALRRDIFHFGMGLDTGAEEFSADRLGNSPSGVSLKFQYTLLDLKAAGAAVYLKEGIKELLTYLTEDYNRRLGTAFDPEKLTVTLNLNRIMNDTETVAMIRESLGLVSRATLLAVHPFVEDVNAERMQLLKESGREEPESKED